MNIQEKWDVNCGNCRHWSDINPAQTDPKLKFGHCRQQAPEPMSLPGMPKTISNMLLFAIWPLTKPVDFCGSWCGKKKKV